MFSALAYRRKVGFSSLSLATCCLLLSACHHKIATISQPVDGVPAIGAKLAVPLPTQQTVVPGVYEIQSGIPYNGSQGMCWDLDTNYPTGAIIIQNPCSGHLTQLFRVNDDMDANGFRTISSTFSFPNFQYVIEGPGPGQDHSIMMQATNKLQEPSPLPVIKPDRFRFNDIPNCGGCRYVAIAPGAQWCVDRPTQHMNPGDYIQPFNCDAGKNQIWIMLGPR